ncbi:MAG TPA: hypothetical protein VE981_21595 [Planctomycetota bacterium]|nr:hypothetical protein [Planctomycetota bacterium]
MISCASLVKALRKGGLPARALDLEKTLFPQPTSTSSSVGKTIAVSRSTRPMESRVARALPGADQVLRVRSREDCPQGVLSCRAIRKRLVVTVTAPEGRPPQALACFPPARFLRDGARAPAWWFSAYETLGGGSPWHDGFDDNGTYYWTVDRMARHGSAAKVVPMGFSRDGASDFGEHPLRPAIRTLMESSGLLDQPALQVYWNLLPVETGRCPALARLHFPVDEDSCRAALPGIAASLVRAERSFAGSPHVRAVWSIVQDKKLVMF